MGRTEDEIAAGQRRLAQLADRDNLVRSAERHAERLEAKEAKANAKAEAAAVEAAKQPAPPLPEDAANALPQATQSPIPPQGITTIERYEANAQLAPPNPPNPVEPVDDMRRLGQTSTPEPASSPPPAKPKPKPTKSAMDDLDAMLKG